MCVEVAVTITAPVGRDYPAQIATGEDGHCHIMRMVNIIIRMVSVLMRMVNVIVRMVNWS